MSLRIRLCIQKTSLFNRRSAVMVARVVKLVNVSEFLLSSNFSFCTEMLVIDERTVFRRYW